MRPSARVIAMVSFLIMPSLGWADEIKLSFGIFSADWTTDIHDPTFFADARLYESRHDALTDSSNGGLPNTGSDPNDSGGFSLVFMPPYDFKNPPSPGANSGSDMAERLSVPEPSFYGSLVLGTGVLLTLVHRRRRAVEEANIKAAWTQYKGCL